jgi:tetratricopeptide (TPR) repeat protein
MSRDPIRLPVLMDLYEDYLDDHDAAWFVQRLSGAYNQGTLERLGAHRDVKVRRAAVLALGFTADYSANPVLGNALTDEDRNVRMLAENGIRNVWNRAGTLEDRQCLNRIIRLNSAQHYAEALRRASDLLKQSPDLAEAWNQRAVAHFALGMHQRAIDDCHQALELNPYHFAAAAGMGQAYIKLGNHAAALDSFRRALRLNRDLEGVRVQVARLTKLVEG